MNKTNDFKFNLPAYSDPVDIADLNDNFIGIDDALMAGLCKKEYTGNNMGSSDPSQRKYAWAPWLEIVNDNEFDVVVTDRNAPVESEEATINIAAGQTFRKYINGRYYMNFYVQDQHDVTFKWFTNAETYINESGGGGGGTGTVTSVSVQGGSGSHLTASGNPIETSGTITINIDDGYSIPSDNEQTAWDGKAADLKAEIDSSTYVLTLQLKDSAGNPIGSEKTIDLPLETMVVNGEYDSQTKKIKLELKNGNYVEFSVADLVSGLQTELSASNKLNPAYIAYDASHRAVSDTEKNTWNAKQNAITDLETIRSGAAAGATAVQPATMTEALAAKQDSLSETQLAAVNSGINNTKVQQIGVNQTNILSVWNKVGTNMFDFDTWANNVTITNNGTKSVSENTITLSATTNSDTYTEFSENQYPVKARIPVSAGDKFYMSWDYSSANNVTGNVYIFGNASTSSMASANATDGHLEYTVPASGISYITMRIGLGTNQSGKSGTWSNIQIIMKSAYDAGLTAFQPFSRPNSDLTYLEAEDRAELVELVDSGAKNKLQNKATSKTENNVTFTVNSDGEVTVSTTAQGASANTSVSLTGAYIPNTFVGNILSGLPSGSTSDKCILIAYSNNGSSEAKAYYLNSVSAPTHEIQNYPYFQLFVWFKSGQIQTTPLKYQPMICTKAAFGVSPKFVPYRPDYQALVDKTTEQTFGIFKYNNNYSITAITRKCNGFAWFTLTVTSTANIAANTNTIIGYVDSDVQPAGASTDRIIFTARVNTDTPSLVHSHIRGGDGYIYINSPTAISAGTSISITGSYKI